MRKKEKNYIFEQVFVETSVDTDHDGKLDLISVYIKRPKSTLQGEKVPAIFVANPYLMTCNENWYIPHNVDKKVKVYEEQNIREEEIRYDFSKDRIVNPRIIRETQGEVEQAEVPENIEFECISEIYDYFIDRGYAAVYSGGLGTRGSDGLTITGSREEILGFKAVIDWLNGRTRAFTDKEKNIEIKAKWCTGKVAMSAKSYLGTMCIAVAGTGVEGLKTIIPEAGISNWYDYYRGNGLVMPALGWQGDDLDILAKYCSSRAKDVDDFKKIKELFDANQLYLEKGEDRDSGNYNMFWDERNYLHHIKNFKASVFIIHGLNDWNVKMNQCIPLFEALEKYNIPRKMHLHQGEHDYIYNLKDSRTTEILTRWLDYYLKGIETGIQKEAKVMVESNLNQTYWEVSDTWPPKGKIEVLKVKETGPAFIVDDLAQTKYSQEKDNQKEWLDELVLRKDSKYQNCLRYEFDPMEWQEGDCRFAGRAKISFEAALDQETAILSAMLVDLGKDKRIIREQILLGDEFMFSREKEASSYKVLTRNSLNAQNRTCIWSKEKIEKGVYHSYSFDFIPTDYRIKKGHKLLLILYGIDAEATQRPDTVTNIKIKQESIELLFPWTE